MSTSLKSCLTACMCFSQTIPLSKFISLFKTHFEKVLHIGCADMILAVLDLCADLEDVCMDCRQAGIKDEEWWDWCMAELYKIRFKFFFKRLSILNTSIVSYRIHVGWRKIITVA